MDNKPAMNKPMKNAEVEGADFPSGASHTYGGDSTPPELFAMVIRNLDHMQINAAETLGIRWAAEALCKMNDENANYLHCMELLEQEVLRLELVIKELKADE